MANKTKAFLSLLISLFLITTTTPFNQNNNNDQPTGLFNYNTKFDKIRQQLEDEGEIKVLDQYEQLFYKKHNTVKDKIHSTIIDVSISEQINSVVSAYNYDKKKGSSTHGTKSNNKFCKIMISGARGKTKSPDAEDISTLALSENVDKNNTAICIAYASRISEVDFVLDAKVDNKPVSITLNADHQLVISSSEGNKYMFSDIKTVVGSTKMYRLAIGKDYLKFEINLLVSGACIQGERVLSKSIIKVMTYLALDDGERCRKNVGLFTSENKTMDKKTHSTHFGFLSVDKLEVKSIQETGGKAKANKKGAKGSTNYDTFTVDQMNRR